jgi:hypothetical protein
MPKTCLAERHQPAGRISRRRNPPNAAAPSSSFSEIVVRFNIGAPSGALALARVHRAYAGIIQARRKRTGHFRQGRFGAVAMDEAHHAAAGRYVSLNPVRVRLVERASTSAHLRGRDDGLTALAPIGDRSDRFLARIFMRAFAVCRGEP